MPHNVAVIFSNGIADFRRVYQVRSQQDADISLPVRTDHVADVLASLNIYGDVRLKEPPSFRPSNEADGILAIDPNCVIEDLATTLSGTEVTVHRAGGEVEGRLVGLHTEPQATGGESIGRKFLVIASASGLVKIGLDQMEQLLFRDADVQKEIDKALERNVQQIKPNSTFVRLTLATEADLADAIVQYTLPAAAWKITYRLRQVADQPFEFQGYAVVDNNTDEDWNDFIISVVTGEPITFSTDLADCKIPRRSHVNVVADSAIGAVEIEEADMMLADEAVVMSAAAPGKARRKSLAKRAYAAAPAQAQSAATDDANVQESGDFCIYESANPVSIGARRSAVIPIFQTTLDNAQSVLHYHADHHPERPYRTVLFENDTQYSLGRGVCTVYREGAYAGSCVMPATRPGAPALLAHALETGVRVHRKTKRRVRKSTAIRLSAGCCYTDYHESQVTEFAITNQHHESYPMIVDHDFQLFQPKATYELVRADGSCEALTPNETFAGWHPNSVYNRE